MCCTRWSTPSLCEMVTGPGFSSPNQPGQVWTTAYRVSSGPNSRSDAHCDTILGDWDEPSGESRLDIISKHFLVEPELLSESDDSDSRPSLLPNYQAWVVRRGVSCHLPAALKVECWFMTA